MPRSKINYHPIDRFVQYDEAQWALFHSIRKSAKQVADQLHLAGFEFYIYGSVARGDVTPKSDIDLIVLTKISSFQIETALEQSDMQIVGKEIVQATPGDAIKGHIYLPNNTAISFFLSEANEVSWDFYKFGGAINHEMLKKNIRSPGVTKALMLIIPNEKGHRMINLIGNETYAYQILNISPKIVDIRKRVLLKRDKVGRTGVFLKNQLDLDQNFEEELKKIADINPIVRRKLLK